MANEVKPRKKGESGYAAASRRYAENQRKKGMTRVSAWVPEDKADEFWAMVDKLRARWERGK